MKIEIYSTSITVHNEFVPVELDCAFVLQTLLDRTQHKNLDGVTTANFYSISATHKGKYELCMQA